MPTFWTEVEVALLKTRRYHDAIWFFPGTWTGRWLSSALFRQLTIGPLTPLAVAAYRGLRTVSDETVDGACLADVVS